MLKKGIQDFNKAICDGIKKDLGLIAVKANQTGHVPPYPYASFSITSIAESGGSYGRTEAEEFKPAVITMSWTVQADNDTLCWEKAQALADWFRVSGRAYLKDQGIAPLEVMDINQRDSLITIEYEFRKGFDVRFSAMNVLPSTGERIQTAEIQRKEI